MNKRMISLMAAALALLSASGQVTFTGVGEYDVIKETPPSNTDLNMIYVLYDINGVKMTFNSTTGERAKWETFYYRDGNLVMEPVTDVRWDGMATTLDRIIPNIGYKIQEGDNRPYYCWVVNYADYPFELRGMTVNYDTPCDPISFSIDGSGDEIPYFDLRGGRHVLDREIKLSYKTKVWDDSDRDDEHNHKWIDAPVDTTFKSLNELLSTRIDPPLCDTEFYISGDAFLRNWGKPEKETYADFQTRAVKCHVTAILDDGEEGIDISNGVEDTEGLSAPAHVHFTGYPVGDVGNCVWEISTDPNFEDESAIDRYYQEEFDYTFDVGGATYYVRFTVYNRDESCQDSYDIPLFRVSESYMPDQKMMPNFFSPGDNTEANNIWKVKTRSLVEFHCWIYNRWGNLVYEYTDPDGGWDGYYNGKLVDTGVYYYVITATGIDGTKYKRRGDINILRYKRGGVGGTSDVGGEY